MVGKLGENQDAHIFATLGTFMVGALHGDFSNTFFLELLGATSNRAANFYLFYTEILNKHLFEKIL